MHLFESWFCKPKFTIEVRNKIDFDSHDQNKASYSIYFVCESEVNADHPPFTHAANIFGETKQSVLYPAQADGKKLFLIAPTQSEPKRLSLDTPGRAHAASHFGAVLAHAILAFPVAHSLNAEFCVTLSDRMKHIIEGEQHEFLLGVLQRSVSHKIKKSRSTEKPAHLEQNIVFRSELFSENAVHKANAISKAMSITRTLINMPANILNPHTYEDCVKFLLNRYQSTNQREDASFDFNVRLHAKPNQISMQVLDHEQLQNLGCGLICAVGRGSTVPPRILKLSYHPSEEDMQNWLLHSKSGIYSSEMQMQQGASERRVYKREAHTQATSNDAASAFPMSITETIHIKHVALVGKGITFDSGGYDLKPASGMRTMKKDMGGSAAVLGVFLASIQLKLPIRLTCYLALAENMISGNAMRPGDIYKAHNGLNVEIDNTDAEGRLVLGDALSLALEEKPDWIIDLATLTGAARTALGPLVDCAFGNRSSLNELLNANSLETGDWIWNLPLPAQYDSYFDSRVADIMNSSNTPYAGAITAALFLQKFVGSNSWNHIDTFMWCDRSQGLWGEDNAPTAKCVRLIVRSLEQYILNRG